MLFHERVKFLLKRRGIKQTEFAQMLELSPARLNNYLTGKTEAGYAVLKKTAELLETSTDYLLGRKEGYLCQKSPITPEILTERGENCISFTQNNDDLAPFLRKGDTVWGESGDAGRGFPIKETPQGPAAVRQKKKKDKILGWVKIIIRDFPAD